MVRGPFSAGLTANVAPMESLYDKLSPGEKVAEKMMIAMVEGLRHKHPGATFAIVHRGHDGDAVTDSPTPRHDVDPVDDAA